MPPNSGPIEVALCDRSRERDWDAYVERSPHTVFAHGLAWRRVVQQTFSHRALYLIAYRDGSPCGILPLFLVRARLLGRFLVTAPFLTFGGLAADGDDVAVALIERAKELARQERVDYLELRDERRLPGLPHVSTDYCTLVLDLRPEERALWEARLHPAARRNVRRARKSGLEVVEGFEQLDRFVAINARNMHRLGTPAHGARFFRSIVEQVRGARLLMARAQETWVAGMLLVPFRDTLLMPWVAGLREFAGARPNNLLYWEAIVRARRAGFRRLDLGRSKWGSGTFRFKAQYGAEATPLQYQFFLNRRREVPRVDPEAGRFRLLVALWRRLPGFVVDRVGPHVIGWIP